LVKQAPQIKIFPLGDIWGCRAP